MNAWQILHTGGRTASGLCASNVSRVEHSMALLRDYLLCGALFQNDRAGWKTRLGF